MQEEEINLQEVTKTWVEAIKKYYQNEPDRLGLTQIFMRGYFAGWSEREVAQLADELEKNMKNYPLN